MTQNNIYMEDDNLKLYVDVQPLFLDELYSSKTTAVESAENAAISAQSAKNALTNITSLKTNLELFYAQATNNLTNMLNQYLSSLTDSKNTIIAAIQSLKTSALDNIRSAKTESVAAVQERGNTVINEAKGYADEAKQTVDNRVSADYLVQSNALEAGEVSTINNVFLKIKQYAHSTFDLSKFTVVGTPTITSDGIASGFGNSNYLTKMLDFSTAQTWEIQIPIKTSSDITTNGQRFINTNINGNRANNILCSIEFSQCNCTLIINNVTIFSGSNTFFSVTTNTNYLIKYGYDGSSYYIKYNSGNADTTVATVTSSEKWSEAQLHNVGRGVVDNQVFSGSVDLKQFSITVDGVPVFSGNKTGIDTIKPDDYTVVGTPTISADGIISDITTSDYIYCNLPSSLATANTWEIQEDINVSSLSSAQRVYQNSYGYGIQNAIMVSLTTTGLLTCRLSNTTTGDIVDGVSVNYTATVGETLKTRLLFTGTAYEFYVNGEKTWSLNSTTKIGATTRLILFSGDNYAPVLGKQDLNSIRVYIDGNLVYQPCLKIPYTESKTGSKITNAFYRNRVSDMYSQFGFANYYTLDEGINGGTANFTLPMGEIFGMLEKIRESLIQMTS